MQILKRIFLGVLIIGLSAMISFADVKVLTVSPRGNVQDMDSRGEITVTFDQAMVGLQELSEQESLEFFKIDPYVEGKFRWQGTATLSFIPRDALPFATGFKVSILRGFKSEVTGEFLKRDYSWEFNTLLPELVFSIPDKYYVGVVELDQDIFLLFNQPMDPKRAKPFIELIREDAKSHLHYQDFNIRNMVDQDMKIFEYHGYKYKLAKSSNSHVVVLSAIGSLKKNSNYHINLKQGLLAKEGNRGLWRAGLVSFKTYKSFKFIRPDSWGELEPSSDMKLFFSTPVKYKELIENLYITPKIDIPEFYSRATYFSYYDKNREYTTMRLNLNLKPSTTYHIKIKGSLTDKYGQVLGQDIETTLVTKDFDPRFNMPDGMGILESSLTPLAHPIEFLNMNEVVLKMALVDEKAMINIASQNFKFNDALDYLFSFRINKIWNPKIQKNKWTLKPIYLKELLGNRKSGYVFIEAHGSNGETDKMVVKKALLQVTDLAITGKFSANGSLVYVSYLKTALPVKNCKIELRNDRGDIIWKGKTNKNGFLRTPGWETLGIVPESKWNRPKLWIIAKKGESRAFIHSEWGTGIYPYHFNIPYDWWPQYPEYQGHIFTDRGIYRPGDTVNIKGVVREKINGKWELPRISEYDLCIKDSRDKEILKEIFLLSEFASFDYSYKIEQTAPTGYYSIYLTEHEVKSGLGFFSSLSKEEKKEPKINLFSSFRVEEYKPASFEVSVDCDKKEYILGDKAKVKINGRYLFGAPMSDVDLKYSLRLNKTYFEPQGYNGYLFGAYFGDNKKYFSDPVVIQSGKTKLDKQGNFQVSKILTTKNIGPFNLIAEGVVTAPNRQRLAGRKTAIVHAGEYYIGLKPKSLFVEKGQDVEINVITILPNGKKVAGKKIFCELNRVQWDSVRKAGVGGRLEWKTERKEVSVSSATIKSRLSSYKWKYPAKKSGYYIFTATGKDLRNNTIKSSRYFYISGTDYCAWQRDDDDKIELISDKKKYKPGDTAKILVKSPYEKANAVVTIEREGIIDEWTQEVVGSADTILVPIKDDYLPNVFVCVMLYQGRMADLKFSEKGEDLGKPSFKIGYTNLPVDTGKKHLKVQVELDKKQYKPGEEVNVELEVRNSEKQGVKSEVAISVVDLGVLNLINYNTPNSFPYFYGMRPLCVQTAEARLHIIGQRNYGEKGKNSGGGGGLSGSGIDLRSKFNPTAYWNPSVLTDKKGKAYFTFNLPDTLSSFRIMATAQTKDSSFGAGEERFVVTKPLILKPSLPRFARVGDKFTAGVICHNNTSKSGTVTVSVKSSGIKLTGQNVKKIQIKKGEVKEITFEFTADKIGDAEFVFYAKMNKETDGLKWKIPISISREKETVATYNSTSNAARETVKIPKNIYTELSNIDISIAPTALVGLKGGLEYLFEYPYGCLEQKTSKILPLIIGADFVKTFDLANLKKRSVKKIVKRYFKELSHYQSYSGGFSFWKNGSISSPYLTAYVLWTMGLAKNKGYKIDETLTQPALKYLQNYLRDNTKDWTWPYSINDELCTKAFCVYVLSLNGVSEQSYINQLYRMRDQLPLLGRVYLLKAISKEFMNKEMIDELVQELYNQANFSATHVYFEEFYKENGNWIWHSNVRTTAAILQAMLELDNVYPNSDKIIKWLVNKRKSGKWLNTQENFYVFYAFQEYVDKYEQENPDFTARILLEGKEIMNEVFKDRTLESRNVKLKVDEYKPDVFLPLNIEKRGQGRLYYEIRMIYAPKGKLGAKDSGIYVEKKIEPFGSGSILKNVYALSGRYKVTLKVKSYKERNFVVLHDPLPAGFEVVDLSLATESVEEASSFGDSARAYRRWGTFDHKELYDDRVILFANYLERGEHTYSYLVQATTSGNFLMPCAKIEEMYNPEVFGRTGEKRISVK
ncbi:alpha-2-macroglobulin [bacterium]